MPRYFFHRVDGVRDPDHEGVELDGIDAARCEAVDFAADTLKDPRFDLWEGGEIRIEVADALGHIILMVRVSAETLVRSNDAAEGTASAK